VITFAYWWFSGAKEHAVIRTATVLIIACPHALGLAIPLVIAISTSLGAQNGLLVKDRLALERARNLDMVIFDKPERLHGAPPQYRESSLHQAATRAICLPMLLPLKPTPNTRSLKQLWLKPSAELCRCCKLPALKHCLVEGHRHS
jgi:hypothetical protein